MTRLTTPLCDLLNIDYPIVQSGMSRVAGPELVAERSGLKDRPPYNRNYVRREPGMADG
jgi:NAD(P)H-dependent flavin oxidoreductase YrpB (nitropropane dioxygenase family)